MGNYLDLSGTKITNAGLVVFRKRSPGNGLSLDLSGTNIDDAGLVHLAMLYELSLVKTAVTGAGLVRLKGMTNLDMLYLSSIRDPEGVIDKLRQSRPRLHVMFHDDG